MTYRVEIQPALMCDVNNISLCEQQVIDEKRNLIEFVALYVGEESDFFFNFVLPLTDIGALYVRKMTISTLTNNYKETPLRFEMCFVQ